MRFISLVAVALSHQLLFIIIILLSNKKIRYTLLLYLVSKQISTSLIEMYRGKHFSRAQLTKGRQQWRITVSAFLDERRPLARVAERHRKKKENNNWKAPLGPRR